MYKTLNTETTLDNSITVSTESLSRLLDCGRSTAVKIGEAADAKVRVGRRVLWNSNKIRKYLSAPGLKVID